MSGKSNTTTKEQGNCPAQDSEKESRWFSLSCYYKSSLHTAMQRSLHQSLFFFLLCSTKESFFGRTSFDLLFPAFFCDACFACRLPLPDLLNLDARFHQLLFWHALRSHTPLSLSYSLARQLACALYPFFNLMGSSTRHPSLLGSTVYSPTLPSHDWPIGASASPLSDLSAGANTAAANNGSSSGPTTTVAPPSAKSRKNPIESKAQKPSFLSLIFCCGANFVNDSDGSALQVGPTRPPTVSTGRAAGKKAVAGQLADEKPPQVQPTLVDITAIAVQEDPVGVSCFVSTSGGVYQWTIFYLHFTTMDQGQGSPCSALHRLALAHFSSAPNFETDMYIAFRCEPRHIFGRHWIGTGGEVGQKETTRTRVNPRHLGLFTQTPRSRAGNPWIITQRSWITQTVPLDCALDVRGQLASLAASLWTLDLTLPIYA
ncbi:MAG: hypothetical protein J3R72DRAFT_223154 [Linnemannia gamsii]|nr:MAG: hypothetical protein J3R72DRAFT_223154 [Linnemannia gamsii]